MMDSISQTKRERIKHIQAGELFTISDFDDVNNDNLVTRTLLRLQNEGAIIRKATGSVKTIKHSSRTISGTKCPR